MSLTRVAALTRALLAWASQPGNERFYGHDQETVLHGVLEDPERQGQVPAAAWLLGSWRLGRGQAMVLQGDAMGWDVARSGISLLRASVTHRWRRQGPDAVSPLQLAHAAMLGAALGEPQEALLGEMLMEMPETLFGPQDQLPLFVRSLYLLREGRRPRFSPRLGPYMVVLHAWDSDRLHFSRVMEEILDHHLERTQRGEFAEPAFSLLPTEVLMTKVVRTELGMQWTKVEHPLMFTNLLALQPRTPWPREPLAVAIGQLTAPRR